VLAKRVVGTNGADMIVGTQKADRINARGGNDRVRGRAGGDRLKGSRGKDRIKGARGKDRISAGRGADRLSAVDDKKDRGVNGGRGEDVCAIDQADLPLLKNCEEAKVKKGGRGGGPGEDELRVTSASGLVCDSSPPLCPFQIEGDGADESTGSVSGGGGVDLAAGAGVAITGDSWTATGLYGCSADGYLKVTIGSKSVRVPITCTA
jgi:Ca2+-binding RTX toxin-like protein